MKFATGLIFVWTCLFKIEASKWGYVGDTGTEHWSTLFPTGCSGSHQSPIDIVTKETVFDPSLKPFSIFFDPPKEGSKFCVHNNGHAIQVDTDGEFYVTNGGLKHVYSTAQFHFHWGHNSHHGSEHTIDGHAAPIEMHIVNWDSDTYKSISEAATQPNGLAVLGIMFEISEDDNPVLEPLINVLKEVMDPDDEAKVVIPAVSLTEFLPNEAGKYYRYAGSLTTPGCFESVVWTIFKEKQTISSKQMTVFRQALKSAHHRRRRSSRREDKIVHAVLQELGIEDNAREKLRFKRTLAGDHTTDMDNVLSDDDPELKSESDGHDDTHDDHDDSHDDDDSQDDDDEDDHYTHHHRRRLVNNFRPVQPIHDRLVYRSFSDFHSPSVPAWKSQEELVSACVNLLAQTFSSFVRH